jgi:hypothetical protein
VAYALGERRWLRMGLSAVLMTVITFFVFTQLLQLNLPVGFDFIFGETEVEEEW